MLRNRTQLVLCPLTRAIAWLERSTQHQSLVPMFPKCETWGTFPVERARARDTRLFSSGLHRNNYVLLFALKHQNDPLVLTWTLQG